MATFDESFLAWRRRMHWDRQQAAFWFGVSIKTIDNWDQCRGDFPHWVGMLCWYLEHGQQTGELLRFAWQYAHHQHSLLIEQGEPVNAPTRMARLLNPPTIQRPWVHEQNLALAEADYPWPSPAPQPGYFKSSTPQE